MPLLRTRSDALARAEEVISLLPPCHTCAIVIFLFMPNRIEVELLPSLLPLHMMNISLILISSRSGSIRSMGCLLCSDVCTARSRSRRSEFFDWRRSTCKWRTSTRRRRSGLHCPVGCLLSSLWNGKGGSANRRNG